MRSRAFTILEAALVLFLVSALSLTGVASLGGQRVQSNDKMSQADIDTALDAVFGVMVSDGMVTDGVTRLKDEAPALTWLNNAATTRGEVSVDAKSDQDSVGLAAKTADGACWYANVRFSAVALSAPRVFAVAPPGTTRACTGTAALALVAYSISAAGNGAVGSSWQNPVVLGTSTPG
jgi:hypothetical protein